MAGTTAAAEAATFQRAVIDFTAQPTAWEPIAAMMELALEAESATLRRWATEWLAEHCGVVAVQPEQGTDHAAPTEANGIR